MSISHEKVYKTKITGKAAGLGALPLAAAFALGYFALDAGNKFSSNDPAKYLFVGLPATISAVIILTLILVCHHFLNRTISINGDELIYTDPKVVMSLVISEMAFSPPPEVATFKTLMISDGSTIAQIPQVFLGDKEFLDLSNEIKTRRRASHTDSAQKTYSL